jgi:hypothetical protein
MSLFTTRQVDRRLAQSVEPLGSKPKFWYRDGTRRLLFKAEDRGTGEDWAEVIACHLCRLLGLPHVNYDLATEFDGDVEVRPGVVCENMATKPVSLVLGNELLLAVDPQYPSEQRFKVRQHTVDAVSDIVTKLVLPAPEWIENLPSGVQSALDVFVGYVMLDAWIANQDRHHENWGALWDQASLRLAPTFDHGAALARNLLDSERVERLVTNDRNRTVAAFATKGRSAFFGDVAAAKPLELRDAFRAFELRAPRAADAWLDQLRRIGLEAVSSILDRVPSERMSEVSKRFTAELLLTNQRRLLE